jgi:hypothetical protein
MVYGVIEIKTTLYQRDLEDAFNLCAKLRDMAGHQQPIGNKSYRLPVAQEQGPGEWVAGFCDYPVKLPPRFFIFGYGGWKTIRTAEEAFIRAMKKSKQNKESPFIHGLCWLGVEKHDLSEYNGKDEKRTYVESFLISDVPYRPNERYRFDMHGFKRFLENLPFQLDSMLPADQSLGCTFANRERHFDRVNIDHYKRAARCVSDDADSSR